MGNMGTCGQIWEQPGTNREIRLPGMHLTIFVKIKESKRIGNPWILFLHKSVTVNLSHLVTTHHHTPTPELTVKTNCSANRGLVATWKMMRLQMSITNWCMWWCRLGLIQWNHSIFIHAEREREGGKVCNYFKHVNKIWPHSQPIHEWRRIAAWIRATF